MVKKSDDTEHANGPGRDPPAGAVPLAGLVKESATQIWLAGLGAFAKAQEEGGKVFEALVREGTAVQRRTEGGAERKIAEATRQMKSLATDISARASGQWDRLENIFEQRVARSLDRRGVPSAEDHAELLARVERLERELGIRDGRNERGRQRRTGPRQPEAATPEPGPRREPESRRGPRRTD